MNLRLFYSPGACSLVPHIALEEAGAEFEPGRDETVHAAIQQGGREVLAQQFAEIEGLCAESWLVEGAFTAADGYALTLFRWGRRIGFDMAAYRGWMDLCARILERLAVLQAIKREGLKAEEFRPG
jgi:glutathione S-transferase